MKIKLIMVTLCFSLILATASCKKVEPGPTSGGMGANISDTSVYCYFTEAFSKNKKQQIILAFWDNIPISGKFDSNSGTGQNSTDITCHLTKSNSTAVFKYVGKFDKKTGKGTVDIDGKTFDVSNGRLFLINTHAKPLKVIQVNEQFNLPPFDNLSWLDDVLPFKKKDKRGWANAFSSCQKDFEYLAKSNKEVAAFLAQSSPPEDKPKTQ